MNHRRRLLLAMAALAAGPALAQQPRQRRVGFLALRSRVSGGAPDPSYTTFVQAMHDLGYREGRNLAIEWRFADNRYDRLPGLADELVRSGVELLVTHGREGGNAARQATKTTPIVVAIMNDPVKSGLVSNLARPGGNLTGLTQAGEEVTPKQLELLKQAMPKLVTVGVLKNPDSHGRDNIMDAVERRARQLGVKVVVAEARSAEQLDGAFARLRAEKAQAVIILTDPILVREGARLARLAAAARIPSVSPYPEHAGLGIMMSYGIDNLEYYRQAAAYVDKILKGARPSDLPVETPTRLVLLVNRKTATEIGVVLPKDLLLRADRVIE